MPQIIEQKAVFIWGKEFETEVSRMDSEHRYLIEIINSLGSHLSLSDITIDSIEPIFNELLEYTTYHFRNEEMLAKEYNIDPRHIISHKKEHKAFIEKVSRMYNNLNQENLKIESKELLDFLVHWLTFHILGIDKTLATQIKLIKNGYTPEEAFNSLGNVNHEQLDTLVKSFNNIFEVLMKYNDELLALKKSLEQKVKERTNELEEVNKRLKILAMTDQLTGLANRHCTMYELDVRINNFNKSGEPFSIIMIDLDDFKNVNDNLGHEAGDNLLILIATAIKDSIRTDDIACRMGGDEFVVICPNTNENGAELLASKISKNINKIVLDIKDQKWQASCSTGMATYSSNTIDKKDLLRIADNQMYKAKRKSKR